MSLEALKLVPTGVLHPAAAGTWTVIKAKSEGVTPGFTIGTRTKRVYFLKFDPLTNPEMATAADVIVARSSMLSATTCRTTTSFTSTKAACSR
jgi:hypothetical protein